MRSFDTSVGGQGRAFPETTAGFHNPSPGDRRAMLEKLCQRYWKPVYVYIRAGWAKSNEDAKDLAQAFFLWIMEADFLSRYEPDRGSFRSYLKVMLRSFVAHQEEAMGAWKRGGGARLISLEGSEPRLEGIVPDPRAVDPEQAFESAWKIELVHSAIERVRGRYVADGQALTFRVYEEYDLNPSFERPTYADLGARLNLTEREVEMRLTAVRERVRSEVREELQRLTSGDRELEDEWHGLFGS